MKRAQKNTLNIIKYDLIIDNTTYFVSLTDINNNNEIYYYFIILCIDKILVLYSMLVYIFFIFLKIILDTSSDTRSLCIPKIHNDHIDCFESFRFTRLQSSARKRFKKLGLQVKNDNI